MATRSDALNYVAHAETLGHSVGMYLSNTQLKELVKYLVDADDENFGNQRKPDGIIIRLGALPEECDNELTIELIPYSNDLVNNHIQFFTHTVPSGGVGIEIEGYMDADLGVPEPGIPGFPPPGTNLRIDNQISRCGGGGNPGVKNPSPPPTAS